MQNNNRTAYIDNIRIFLTIMVILVHASVTYGGEGGWYVEEETDNMLSIILLTMFNAVNQSYFMSLFFLISGFFSAKSLDSHKVGAFTGSRLLRLGLPLLAFTYFLNPLTNFFATKFYGGEEFVFTNNFQVGPMWFPLTLLIFTAIYMIIRKIIPFKSNKLTIQSKSVRLITLNAILILSVVIALLTFGARAVWPMGEGALGMQFGSFPQYIIMFSIGIFAWRNNWESQIMRLKLSSLSFLSGIFIILLPVIMFLGEDPVYGLELFMGGFSWQAASYAIWESVMCVLMSLLVLRLMYSKANFTSKAGQSMSRAAYAVYIIHPPVLVLCSAIFIAINAHPLFKFLLVGSVAVSMSYGFAKLLIRIPMIKKII